MYKIIRFFLAAFCLTALLCLVGCVECLHTDLTETPVAPTCDTEGYTLCVCNACGWEYKKEMVAPVGHTLTAETVAPTCTEQGYTEYTCICGYSFVADTHPSLGHTFQEMTVLPTCTSIGYSTYTCACGYSYRAETTQPLGHDLAVDVVFPTCTEQGYSKYVCRTCQMSYTSDWTSPTGHDFACEIIGPTTCQNTGYSRYTCLCCEYTYIGDYLFYSDVFEGAYGASITPLAHGIDVSKYNHEYADGAYQPLDFEAIKAAGFDFVILKIGSTPRTGESGQQKGGMEPTFEADYAAAKAAGLDVGVYFYTYSKTVEETEQDAELVMTWLAGKSLEYPVYFDIEDPSFDALSRKEITDLCVTFISSLQENHWFGALYTNNYWLVNRLQNDKVTFLFDIWYARYPTGDGPFEWNAELYGEQLGMWQYTQTGKIPSLSDRLTFDFSYAYKDYPSIIGALGYNGLDEP